MMLHQSMSLVSWEACQYDRHVFYEDFKKTYTFNKDGNKIVLAPLKPTLPLELEKDKCNIIPHL